MCPYSSIKSRSTSDAQEDTYGESEDPTYPVWIVSEHKLKYLDKTPNQASLNPFVSYTNFRNRFFNLGEPAQGLSTEVTFTQENRESTDGDLEYPVYPDWAPTECKSEDLEILPAPEWQQSLVALKQIPSKSPSVSTENLPSSNKHELFEIIYISYLLAFLGYPKCARRIEFLKNCDDFEEGEEPLSLESAKSFLEFVSDTNFVNRFSNLGEPALGLSADGTLGATWRIADNKHLLVKFHRSPMVSFAMIGPNPASPEDGKFRLNGRNTREGVIKTLHKQGVTDW